MTADRTVDRLPTTAYRTVLRTPHTPLWCTAQVLRSLEARGTWPRY